MHVGGGPLKDSLQGRAKQLGITHRVEWRGALTQDELLVEYRGATATATACRTC